MAKRKAKEEVEKKEFWEELKNIETPEMEVKMNANDFSSDEEEVVAETIVEQPQEPIKPHNPKYFMYQKWDGKMFRTRRFTLQTMDEDDMNYFLRNIGKAYNDAPLPAQIEFMIHAWPGMQNFLKDRYPDILVEMEKMIAEVDVLAENIIEGKTKSGLTIVN